jgi:uncharacterized cupredoxin-like copper-binding protein
MDEFNLKVMKLVSGKEIIADVEYNEQSNVYVLEFPLSVAAELDEYGKGRLILGRYILAGDYDHTMILTPSTVECIAGVTRQMQEQYLDERAHYFDMVFDRDEDESLYAYEDEDEFEDYTISDVPETIH